MNLAGKRSVGSEWSETGKWERGAEDRKQRGGEVKVKV